MLVLAHRVTLSKDLCNKSFEPLFVARKNFPQAFKSLVIGHAKIIYLLTCSFRDLLFMSGQRR